MKHKYSFLLAVNTIIATASFGQTVKEKIEVQSKDPRTMENAAKADVFISKDRSVIADKNIISANQNIAYKKTTGCKAKKKRLKKS